jgi:hypothetical protein
MARAFADCIAEIVTAGRGQIDEAEAEEILTKVFDRASRQERRGTPRAQALQSASRTIADEERMAALVAKRSTLINKAARAALDERVIRGQGQRSVRALLTGFEGRGRMLGRSIDAESHANVSRLMGGAVAELRKAGLLGVAKRRDEPLERDVARELFRLNDPEAGAPTGNRFAEQIATIMHRWQEVGRKGLNDAGAFIGKLDHYITRQSHDMEKIRLAGYQAWRDHIEPRLDEKTFEGVADRDAFLKNVYDALSSGVHDTARGANWLDFKGPGNLAKQLSHERKLHFKDADSWFDYNKQYGRGNVIDSIFKGLEHAGRNTALMRHLGTNPQAMLHSWIDDLAGLAKKEGNSAEADKLMRQRDYTTQQLLDIITGASANPVNMRLANYAHAWRAWQSMSKLGQVVASSIPDIAVNASTLRWNGVPLLEAYTQTALAPLLGRRAGAVRGSPEIREIADLLGVGFGGMLGQISARIHAEDFVGHAGKMLELFHRVNLLSYWTDSMKTSVGLMLSHNLARNSRRGFDALPERLRITLQRYGIEAAEWDAIRQVQKRAADGRDYILPGEIANLSDDAVKRLAKNPDSPGELGQIKRDLQDKYGTYIIDQTREGMTEPTAADRRTATWGTRPGTALGEAVRLFMQFKQFPLTFMRRSVGRELLRRGDPEASGLARFNSPDVMGAAYLIAGTTILGYVAMTAKELAKGRNPRWPEDTAGKTKLVMAAMVQGGGLGIYGDFLFGEASRFGHGIVGSAAGPTAGTFEDAVNLFQSLRDGSNTKTRAEIAASEGLQIAKSNTPFINLFYTRMALDYFVLHRLQEAVNPGYLRRYEQRVKRENDQTFWLRPTESPY